MAIEDFDDQSLIILSQKGDKQAFGILVNRYMQRAYFVALGLVSSHDDALDLSQDAFVRAYRAIKRFEPGKQFFTWFYQILRNLCFNFLRDRKRKTFNFSDISENEVLHIIDEKVETPDVILEKKDLANKLWHAIHKLPKLEKEIIILREFQDFSYQDIADTLQCPIGTVMSRLYYARKHLAEGLQDEL